MRLIVFATVILFCHSLFSQSKDTINQLNAQGKKQGFWVKKDKNGAKIYEGNFKDGIPVGSFTYYYPSGTVKARTFVTNNGIKVKTVTYFTNGRKNAEGTYVNEKRDSTWRFYSEVDEALVSEEFYLQGKKEGKAYTYYPGEGKSEMITWKNDVKEGPWETYYPSGVIKVKCLYKHGEKDGTIQVNFLSGKPMLTGLYNMGTPVGTWVYYKEKGGILKKEFYNQKGMILKIDSTGH